MSPSVLSMITIIQTYVSEELPQSMLRDSATTRTEVSIFTTNLAGSLTKKVFPAGRNNIFMMMTIPNLSVKRDMKIKEETQRRSIIITMIR